MNGGKKYVRVMLGRQSANADDGINGGFIAVGYIFGIDLTKQLIKDPRDFNQAMRPVWLKQNPEKTKVAAGLACGTVFTVCEGLNIGDIVMSPDRNGDYHFGEVTGDYEYDPNYELPHKRPVQWLGVTRHRNDLSDGLQRSIGSMLAVSNVTKYAEEIEAIVGNLSAPKLLARDETVEDPSVFALEMHLEEFLVANWSQTMLGKTHDIYTEDGEVIGQQYPSDTGPLDILAISKDGKELLVVELKKGRASDAVVGQVQRYMGFVLMELAEEGQTVRGAIIALEQDKRIERALSVAPNIDFYRYEVRFDLIRSEA